MVATRRSTVHNKKRHGHHQNRNKQFLQVYSPYLPMLVFAGLLLIAFLSFKPNTNQAVLGANSSLTADSLLKATNENRQAHNLGALALNHELSEAAQKKANDMVSRNYWSHVTPSGEQPWQFVSASGYPYAKAAENLAYGLDSGNRVVTGWMNSAPHRANVLDSAYQDVGFGIADSSNFNNAGPQTVVVALYGTTQLAAASSGQVLSSSNTRLATTEPSSLALTRMQTLASVGPLAPQLSIALVLAASIYLSLTQLKAIKRALKKTERYIIKHPIIDSLILIACAVIITLSRHAGSIR